MASEVIDWRDKARAGIRIAALMAEQERLTALLAERDAAQALSAMTARKLTEQLDHAETLASRLAAAEAALEAENKALREFVLDAIDCLERLDGPRRPNTLGWSEEVRLALHALCKPLAASGGGEG